MSDAGQQTIRVERRGSVAIWRIDHPPANLMTRALEMMLEARTVEPEQALELGVLHRVVEPGELLAEARATAERLARRAPLSVRALKRAVHDGSSGSLERGVAIEHKSFLASCSQPEAQRAIREYVEEVERSGVPGWADPEARRAWQEGTRVDMGG